MKPSGSPTLTAAPICTQQVGAFPVLEHSMKAKAHTRRTGFSMIELAIVVSIIGIISAIAIPKFADGASGRKLQGVKKQLLADIQTAKIRARATSTQHTIKFFVSDEIYVIVEGNEIKKDAIVISRDLTESPFDATIRRTNLGGDEVMVITPYGDLSPSGTIRFKVGNERIDVLLEGIADTGVIPIVTDTAADLKTLTTSKVSVDALESLKVTP
jgi:prepilin-type N-terminal cleavage/methylation domain-containing protein